MQSLLNLIFGSVVSAAAAAFHAIRMEPSFAVESAVVAFYGEHVIFLHWKLVNQCVHPVIVFGPSLG